MLRRLCFLPPGEHDVRPGGERHAGGEGRQEGVHRPVNQDADHRRGQKDHAHRNAQPPFCYHVTSARFSTQLTVCARLQLLLQLSAEEHLLQTLTLPLCLCSVKSCFQNMEICKRRVNMYDTVNQSKTPFITHVAPSTSTNLTMTFNNQLNTVHSQVSENKWLKLICKRWQSGIRMRFIAFSLWVTIELFR